MGDEAEERASAIAAWTRAGWFGVLLMALWFPTGFMQLQLGATRAFIILRLSMLIGGFVLLFVSKSRVAALKAQEPPKS